MKCSPVYSAILLHLSILLIATSTVLAAPPSPLPKELIDSVVLLRSRTNSVCATGFILADGTLVTNAHVSDVLCPSGSCQNMEILRAPQVGAEASNVLAVQASIKREVPVLDVTFLTLKGDKPVVGYFSASTSALPGDPLYSLGFPKCGPLTLSEGTLTSVDNMKLLSSTRSAHGSSGSPLFGPNFKLVAVAQEADSLSGGLLSMLSDYTFETIALRADVALQLRDADDDELLLQEANFLLANYRDQVRTLSGLKRLRAAISFSASVENLRDSILFSRGHESETKVMAALGQYLDYIPYLSADTFRSELLQRLATLVLAYNLEIKGAHQQFLIPAAVEPIFDSLNREFVPTQTREQFQELIMYAIRDRYQGLEFFGLVFGAKVAALVIAIVALLGWSMGYVFAGTQGSIFKRLIWAVAALLLWPLPMLAVWYQRQKAKRLARAQQVRT
ncbi:MAG: trypsin-like peptidase domain-containing protein [Deltaproteobacteria bacterium]|nr:trypsin-like peptidase domain-containing protein [Deltaproteobacteria bacterium]